MDMTVLSEEELYQQFRLSLQYRNTDLVRDIVKEYGRRGLDKINGEPIEKVFSRNPIFKVWYDKGKDDV